MKIEGEETFPRFIIITSSVQREIIFFFSVCFRWDYFDEGSKIWPLTAGRLACARPFFLQRKSRLPKVVQVSMEENAYYLQGFVDVFSRLVRS